MKTTTNILLTAILFISTVTSVKAQSDYWEAKKAPLPTDKILGTITMRAFLNSYTWKYKNGYTTQNGQTVYTSGGWDMSEREFALIAIKNEAYFKFPDTQDKHEIRDISYYRDDELKESTYSCDVYTNYIRITATVVLPGGKQKNVEENPLSKALDKALLNIREGARIAIDMIKVPNGIDKEEYKDQVVEILLEKEFKVVAKEYLEKLYEEQQSQQSGIYNEKTTVKDNNFSAVGYYLNVRLTETALRVQVINVSTGEYEGNVTIKLQQ